MSKSRFPGSLIASAPTLPTNAAANGVFDVNEQYAAARTTSGVTQWPGNQYNISRSVRFRSGAPAYFTRTPTVAGNRRTFTISAWIKRGRVDEVSAGANAGSLFGAGNTGNVAGFKFSFSDIVQGTNGCVFSSQETVHNVSNQFVWYGTEKFRDPSAWYHVVAAFDTTQSDAGNRLKIYVNGKKLSYGNYTVALSQNQDLSWNNTVPHFIGAAPTNTSPWLTYFEGYMAEVYSIDGQQLDASYFGYFDGITKIWVPKAYTGTYGTNGFYLPFNVDTTFSTDFVVLAGAGGGGSNRGGGGGAGGFRTSAGTSGGNSSAESPLSLTTNVAYTITVGAGGPSATNGNNSVLGSITSTGGGRGGGGSSGSGSTGGSGGGGSGDDETGYVGTSGQGFAGGNGEDNGGSGRAGGGGGGAGAAGATAVNGTFTAGNGGAGIATTITGSSVTYAGGGGGGYLNNGTAGTAGTGGSGGGGNGASGSSGGTGGSASANTGSGGGGAAAVASGGSGGSGIVIIKIPQARNAIFSGGVTQTSTTSGGYRIFTVTATSTTSETVTFV